MQNNDIAAESENYFLNIHMLLYIVSSFHGYSFLPLNISHTLF